LIVVDDGSTDASAEIASRYEPRLRLVRQRNQGQSAHWRSLVDGSGRPCGALSADDLYRPGAVAAVAQSLERHPEAVLHIRTSAFIDERGALRRTMPFRNSRASACTRSFSACPARVPCSDEAPWSGRRVAERLPADPRPRVLPAPGPRCGIRARAGGPRDFRIHSESTTYSPVPVQRADEPLRMVASFPCAGRPSARSAGPDQPDLGQCPLPDCDPARAVGRRWKAARHYLLALTHDPRSVLLTLTWCVADSLASTLGLAPGKFE